MKYALMLLIALFLAGCSAAPPAAQGTPPPDQPSIAQPAATNEPEPATATVIPSPVSETVTSAPPTATAIPSPVTDPPEPVSTTVVAQGPTATPQVVGQVSSVEAEQIIAPTARQAIEALKNRDMVRLAGMAHPAKGVVFSAYGRVDANSVVLKPEQLSGALTDPTIRHWGSYDGTGEPIDLTFAAYFDRFVYSHDFASAPQIGYNQVLGPIYSYGDDFPPDTIMVEYHFPGFDPQYEGMDWQSLRLVFEQQDQTWYLVGILHNQWMI